MAIGWAVLSRAEHVDNRVAPGIVQAEGAQLVAIYSRDRQGAEHIAENHGALAAYTSLEAVLEDSRIDVVWVASPNFLHAPYAKMAAQAGKHVLVEKPMATTAVDGVDMIRTCRAQGVKLGVGYHLSHHPGHIEARRLIQEGVLGTVALAQAQFCAGDRGMAEPPVDSGLSEWRANPEMIGGASAITIIGVHCINLLYFLLGQDITEATAITDGQTPEKPLEDLATMCLRFSKGAIGMVTCSRMIPDSKNDATIYGSNGRIVLKSSLAGTLQGELEVISDTVNTTIEYPLDNVGCYKRQVEAFNHAINNDEEPRPSGLDGLKIVQATEAVVESAKTGQRVRVEPISP